MKRIIVLCLLSGALVLGSAATSFARNTGNKAQLALTCDGESHTVTIAGNGAWAPARDNDTTTVFHPTAFGEVTRTFYPADGSAAQTEIAPAHEFQAQQQNGHVRVDCSFLYQRIDASGRYVDTGTVGGWLS